MSYQPETGGAVYANQPNFSSMIKLLPFLLTLPLLLLSCTHSGKKTNKIESEKLPYHINLTEFGSRDLLLSEFAEDVSYIPLDTKGIIVGDQCKVFASPDGFLVYSYNQELMSFSKEGKFLNKIGRIGKGPQEYTSCSNAQVDFVNKLVYIPFENNYVQVFNLEGKYVRQYFFPGYDMNQMQILFANSKFYVSGITVPTDTYTPLTIYLADGTRWKAYKMASPVSTEIPDRSPFCIFEMTSDNAVVMNEFSYDTSYLISDQGDWEPYVVFDRGSAPMPQEAKFFRGRSHEYRENNINAVYIKDRGPVILLVNCLPTDYYSSCFIKETGEFFQFSNNGLTPGSNRFFGIQNDIDGGPGLHYHHTLHSRYAYCVHQAIDLIEWKKTGYFDRLEPKFPDKKKALLEMIELLKPDDNPVVMIVKIKD